MDKKALPYNTIKQNTLNNMAVIRQKMPEKKHMLIGIVLCLVLGIILFVLTKGVVSEKAELTRSGEPIYATTEGIVYEVLIPKGEKVRQGDAILRFDPAFIRSKNIEIRSYLQSFQQNRHNPGSLRQIFKPLLQDVFAPITEEVTALSEVEAKKLKELQEITREHTKIQVRMRSKSSYIDGKPNPELIEQEKALAKKVQEKEEELEIASLARASADKKYRDLTNSLGQANSILYRYLEEEYNKSLLMQKNEYVYSPFNAIAGETRVRKGSFVQKGDLLMELHPDTAQDWWVRAEFTTENAKKLKNRQVCTVKTEDGEKLEARIFSIEPRGEITVVKLFIIDAPENLEPSEFVQVIG